MSSDTYDIVVVKHGSRVTRRSAVFLNYAATGLPDAEIVMDYFFWIVRNEERSVLVDTGFAPSVGRRRGRTVLADPIDVARRLGVGPDTAPAVVVTHAHYDHIGNLAAFDRSPIYISRAELSFWSGPMSRRGEFAALTEVEELAALRDAEREGRVIAVEDGFELAPGIRLLVVGGHTPGQLIVEVRTSDGLVLLASDALHYEEEMDADLPFTHLADLPDAYRALDFVRAAREEGATVVPGHDPSVLASIGRPLEGFADITATIGIDARLERTAP